MNPSTTPKHQNQDNANISYSSALAKQQFPSKEQAIVFGAIENTKLQDYLIPLGNLVQPKNIIFSSRLSNNRICMYLSSKQVVNDFMINHGCIKIQGVIVKARKLISPAERIVLSNVCPTIPHDILLDELKKFGLNPVSPLTFLRITSTLPEYNHILSFRRQIYVSPHNIALPESFTIDFDNTSYRIFISQDNLACYNCKKPGHIASKCPNSDNLPISHTQPIAPTPTAPSSTQPTEHPVPITSNIQPLTQTDLIPPEATQTESSARDSSMEIANSTNTKRSIHEVVTPETDPSTKDYNNFPLPKSKRKPKKVKTSGDNDKSNQRVSAKEFIDKKTPPFVLSYEQLTLLLSNITGATDPISIVEEFTTDLIGLTYMLTQVYPLLNDRTMKSKITTLKKKIFHHLGKQPSEYDSDSSTVSCY